MRRATAIIIAVLLTGCSTFESARPILDSDSISGVWKSRCLQWTFRPDGTGLRQWFAGHISLDEPFEWHGDKIVFDPFDEDVEWSWEIRINGKTLFVRNREDGTEIRLWPEEQWHGRSNCG